MSQSEALIDTLKRILRMHGLTYRKLAEESAMSESTIKRMFSTGNISLKRLEKICELAQVSVAELVEQMDLEMRTVHQLSEDQENEITSDHGLLLVTFLVINGWKYDEILNTYSYTPHQLVKYLATLDRIKLIELLPRNRFHLLVSPHFGWRRNGPIQRFFVEKIQRDFLGSQFTGETESLLFLSGMLTVNSRSLLNRRLEDVAKEFNELNRKDRQLPLEHRQFTSLIMALRPWRASLFKRYLRDRNSPSQ